MGYIITLLPLQRKSITYETMPPSVRSRDYTKRIRPEPLTVPNLICRKCFGSALEELRNMRHLGDATIVVEVYELVDGSVDLVDSVRGFIRYSRVKFERARAQGDKITPDGSIRRGRREREDPSGSSGIDGGSVNTKGAAGALLGGPAVVAQATNTSRAQDGENLPPTLRNMAEGMLTVFTNKMDARTNVAKLEATKNQIKSIPGLVPGGDNSATSHIEKRGSIELLREIFRTAKDERNKLAAFSDAFETQIMPIMNEIVGKHAQLTFAEATNDDILSNFGSPSPPISINSSTHSLSKSSSKHKQSRKKAAAAPRDLTGDDDPDDDAPLSPNLQAARPNSSVNSIHLDFKHCTNRSGFLPMSIIALFSLPLR
ncbi:hypothetical protein QBC37DRAFT_403373 [Rhypophila decipiens]|uniref:Uncharacterized protein n=1 Tax=Rhypophila decipiens TaxID=261697 RepID=A0AAN6Y5I5_9PEZI|nr:hypothetical protein QBC37DRAFT_403373 [Rhypophila decipiens]